MGGYQSGQMGQTVNLLAYAFVGSKPTPPTKNAVLAQLVEQLFCKQHVMGSSPLDGSLNKNNKPL